MGKYEDIGKFMDMLSRNKEEVRKCMDELSRGKTVDKVDSHKDEFAGYEDNKSRLCAVADGVWRTCDSGVIAVFDGKLSVVNVRGEGGKCLQGMTSLIRAMAELTDCSPMDMVKTLGHAIVLEDMSKDFDDDDE